jgi:hypothetical protein
MDDDCAARIARLTAEVQLFEQAVAEARGISAGQSEVGRPPLEGLILAREHALEQKRAELARARAECG